MPETTTPPSERTTGRQEPNLTPQPRPEDNRPPAPDGRGSNGSATGVLSQQPEGNRDATPEKKPGKPWVKPLMLTLVAVGVVIAAIYGFNAWQFNKAHVSTDDAYVTGNLVNVSPIISGTLEELTVEEGQYVKKGQLIARLDDAGPQATLRQAQANLNAALSQIPEAERNLRYQQLATNAAIQKAKATVATQQAKTSGAAQQVALTSATVQNQVSQAQSQVQAAQAQYAQSLAQVQSAQASVENYQQAIQTVQASLANYQQQVLTAQKAAQAAQSRVQAAQSEADRTAKDEARYRTLYQEDAVAQQVYDNAHAQATNARANLQAAQAEAEQAQSQVEQARTNVQQGQSQVAQARKNVTQAEAQRRAAQRAADAVRDQVKVARAGLGLAQANRGSVGIQQANYLSTQQQVGETQADLASAQAGSQQVAARQQQINTFRSQAAQAQAAVTNAQIVLGDTRIYAPNDGMVVRKNANVGASLSPGQTIVTITQDNSVWVSANFKETQLTDVRPGQPAEIEVDSFPKMVFKGRVQSINRATGAATSLLPPDNATGNFTKVVQRIPVRIEFVPAADNEDRKYARLSDIQNLRQGMSVTATIDIRKKGNANQNGTGSESASAGATIHSGSLHAAIPYRAGTALASYRMEHSQPYRGAHLAQ